MKFNQLATFIIAVGLVFSPASDIFAKGKSGGKKPPAKKEIPPNHSTITAVSESSITVSTKGGSDTYSIGQFTTIILEGQRAKASDLKVGMFVMVGGDSSKKASTITASNPPANAKK